MSYELTVTLLKYVAYAVYFAVIVMVLEEESLLRMLQRAKDADVYAGRAFIALDVAKGEHDMQHILKHVHTRTTHTLKHSQQRVYIIVTLLFIVSTC